MAASPGAVSAAEAAAAVRSMLTAAGLPGDPAADALLERSLALQADLRLAQDRLARLEQVVPPSAWHSMPDEVLTNGKPTCTHGGAIAGAHVLQVSLQ